MLKVNGKKLVKDIEYCRSHMSKAFGLMFRRKLRDKALVFVFDKPQYVPLHMMFVFQKIDVLFLDEKKKVVELWKNFLPFAMRSPFRKAKYVIELPAGTADKVNLGDSINFK